MEALILANREDVFNGLVDEAILPCSDGELSIWSFHVPSLFVLKAGKLTVKSRQIREDFDIEGGLARFQGNRLVVICDI